MNKPLFKRATLALAVTYTLGWASGAQALELTEALRAALRNDPTLAVATANRDAAAQNIDIARARLLPQVSIQTTENRLHQESQTAFGPSEFVGVSRNSQINLRQGVFRPRDWAGLDIGKLQAQYGEHKLNGARAELWSRTVFAWLDVLGGIATRDAYARSVASAQTAAEQEKRRFERGDGTRDAAAEAAAQLAQVRAQAMDAEQELLTRRQALKVLTGVEGERFERFVVPDGVKLNLPIAQLEVVLERVREANPELMAARIAEAINEKKISQAHSDHWPTLDIVGSGSKAKNDGANSIGTRHANQQIGLQLSMPIYAGGGISAAQRQATAVYTASVAETLAQANKMQTGLNADWNALAGLRARLGSTKELLASAREQRRAAEIGMRAGVKTWGDLSAADQLIARREADNAVANITSVKLQARMLSLLPPDDPVVEQWTRQLEMAVSP